MLTLKLQDKIPSSEVTKVINVMEYTLEQKWKWAGHIARMKDNRWTAQCGNQVEGRDQGDSQAEDGKTT